METPSDHGIGQHQGSMHCFCWWTDQRFPWTTISQVIVASVGPLHFLRWLFVGCAVHFNANMRFTNADILHKEKTNMDNTMTINFIEMNFQFKFFCLDNEFYAIGLTCDFICENFRHFCELFFHYLSFSEKKCLTKKSTWEPGSGDSTFPEACLMHYTVLWCVNIARFALHCNCLLLYVMYCIAFMVNSVSGINRKWGPFG